MKTKFSLLRADGTTVDLFLLADAEARVADVAEALAERDPRAAPYTALPGALTLAVVTEQGERLLDPLQALTDAAFLAADRVRIGQAPDTRRGRAAAVLRILSGPAEGTNHTVPPGTTIIGRGSDCDIVLDDPMVSQRHARLDVGNTAELTDLGSANGLLVDGGVVSRLNLAPEQVVVLGDTLIAVELLGEPEVSEGTGGRLPFTRAPRLTPRFPARELSAPVLPVLARIEPFSWFALVAPIVMAGAMFVLTRSPFSLLFVAMTPLMAIGRHYEQRARQRKALAESIAQFEDQLRMLEEQCHLEQPRERAIRLAETPAASDVLAQLAAPGGLTWTRRPEHPSFLSVRLGLGSLPSRITIAETSESYLALEEYAQHLADFRERVRLVDGVPIVESFHDAGAIGISGDSSTAGEVLNGVIVQLTGLHAPRDLAVVALASPAHARELSWLSWLPHTAGEFSPFDGVHLADSPATGQALLAGLEELVQARSGGAPGWRTAMPQNEHASSLSGRAGLDNAAQPVPATDQLPAILLIVTDDAPVARERLIALAEQAADAGIHLLWLAPSRFRLPAVCRTFVDIAGDEALIGHVRTGHQIKQVQLERVTTTQATAFARRLAPLVDDGTPLAGNSSVPAQISLLTLLGTDLAERADSITGRWRETGSIADRTGTLPVPQRPGSLRAVVGATGEGGLLLDLRTQGPHALVGGTTGSGKSEFLQAWVLALAATYSPDRVTFLFVDYKGGSAFADCVDLPHCVGLVTDLTPHLVQRALTSLRAELHRREELLNEKKAKDLPTLEQRGDPDAPPALVLVIDEFAALAGDVPEFVDGVVDIAQRGRSLGIHLIMATQRPAGVIKDNLRANTNLRIALRMADEHDSQDVVGERDAAHFDAATPGRAVAKFGPGRLTLFQSAYAGGRTEAQALANVEISTLGFGTPHLWAAAEQPPVVKGPSDQNRLVASVREAATQVQIPLPRRPWLPELPAVLDLRELAAASDERLILGLVDEPHRQRQRPFVWLPEREGTLAIIGTGASGKSTALRTIAAASARAEGWVQVQAIDTGGGALRMLETLGCVGSVIDGDDSERVTRLLSETLAEMERRLSLFASAHAATLSDYRLGNGDRIPRTLLLLDGFPAFRDRYDTLGSAPVFHAFGKLILEGRAAGIHIALTTDRLGAIPSALQSGITRRMSLRQADDSQYAQSDVPRGMLGSDSPPGRAAADGRETQIAVLGGSASISAQAEALAVLAAERRAAGDVDTPAVRSLPDLVHSHEIDAVHDGLPVLGVSGTTLAPLHFNPAGTFLIGGGVQSGRSNALGWMVQSLRKAHPGALMFLLGPIRSPLLNATEWAMTACTPEEALTLCTGVAERMQGATPSTIRLITVIAGLGDLQSTIAEPAVIALAKTARRTGHTLIAEGESHVLASGWPLYTEFKVARRGIVLQPSSDDGELILRTSFPRIQRDEFPPGRGIAVLGREMHHVQVPLLAPQNSLADHTE